MSQQKPMEVILMRLLAGYLATPMLLLSTDGTLLYFNEPAEAFLGMRFEETGELSPSVWTSLFALTDGAGAPVAVQELPPMIALTGHRPAHRSLRLRGLDGKQRHLELLAFPLIGVRDIRMGAVALLWEAPG